MIHAHGAGFRAHLGQIGDLQLPDDLDPAGVEIVIEAGQRQRGAGDVPVVNTYPVVVRGPIGYGELMLGNDFFKPYGIGCWHVVSPAIYNNK